MQLKSIINALLPAHLKIRFLTWKEKKALSKVSYSKSNPSNLTSQNSIDIPGIFANEDITALWENSQAAIQNFGIPNGTGGVSIGDRRALFYLVKYFAPISILEVGTHIGASTVHIAAASQCNFLEHGERANITSVDISDVNSIEIRPWEKYGVKHSPIEMISRLTYQSHTKFVAEDSLDYLKHCKTSFDLIFLDGDHSASTVYKEVPLSLDLLKPNGIVLLHDYFPNLRPLWHDNSVIPGPFLAINRLLQENSSLNVLPLGALPWRTKENSNVTSLAILSRN